jgi:hypothetical protein
MTNSLSKNRPRAVGGFASRRSATFRTLAYRLVPLLGVVVLLTNIPLYAQTAKTGEPQVNDLTGGVTNSPIFLDAKQ